MLDFLTITAHFVKKDVIEIYPNFIIKKSKDLMIRGGDFYCIWDEKQNRWSTEELDAISMIDEEIDKFVNNYNAPAGATVIVRHMWDSKSGVVDRWHKYCQKQMRDNYHTLDEEIIFSNTKTTKLNYSSKSLSYALEPGDISSYDKLIGTLYEPDERQKLEWAIGSIVSGCSKKIQKFIVIYGEAGAGKSTVLEIIQNLFDGYYSTFDSKALGNINSTFALEPFKQNPLVAIEHDGDLSRIEDNTRLNMLVSHELMTVNEKHKSIYSMRFNSFLFLGSNKPVKITDAKSGLLRRLIDVTPSGNKVTVREYKKLMNQIKFELGGIAAHCLKVFESDPGKYDHYIPTKMLSATNDFYNFILDSYVFFNDKEGVTLKAAWERYKNYCEEARVPYPLTQRIFKEELKNYFKEFKDRKITSDGSRVRNCYIGLREDKFEQSDEEEVEMNVVEKLVLDSTESIFDVEAMLYPAQYASKEDIPVKKWTNVKTVLRDLNTSEVHFVKVPENHIVIDFDLVDESGKKSLDLNLKAAALWPATYAEISKGGNGIHLHYIYNGDIKELSPIFDDHIEVKVFTGGSSLRRRLTKCNNHPIATLNGGLPKKAKKMINQKVIQTEKKLRSMIHRNLSKEIHSSTASSVSFIKQLLDDAYESGLNYDVSDLYNCVLTFAVNSTNQRDNCIKMVKQMRFKSESSSEGLDTASAPFVFFDVEIFPNLFILCWQRQGSDEVISMVNPTSKDIENLMNSFRLIGFNNRNYDNHILYARFIGYSVEQLYQLSSKIINDKGNRSKFGEAYNISYTDIYDFSSTKQSLKKWEIEMGIHHQELGLPWDEPVPPEKWDLVADYCKNDVRATAQLFDYIHNDYTARLILAKLANGTPNDTTNTLTTKLIFGTNRYPQTEFNYPDLSKKFPGYIFENGKSLYKGFEVGEGGFSYSEPGIYYDVDDQDITSMHPSTIISEQLFGPRYTKIFEELVQSRIYAKHKDREHLETIFNGQLKKWASGTDEELAGLAQALKIAINSVYGLTAAKFDNAFRDRRNVDNVVAKRGSLFMVTLLDKLKEMGVPVAHIKVDSIKIPNATDDIIQFIRDFGKSYGYSFETEAKYKKFCLVNKSVYVAQKYDGSWTATGTQFQIPYVFKTLFSKEPIEFEDLCVTNQSSTSIYLDLNEDLPDDSLLVKELRKAEKNNEDPEIIEDLKRQIEECHRRIFIGKVGRFCPMKPGVGAGQLVYISKDGTKYSSVTGSKGYIWMESETVKKLGLEHMIDRTYFETLCQDAIDAINQFGDFEKFVNE